VYEFLFWIYLTNSVLLITHEIDSAYWEEWKLFKLPGSITGFLLLHIPLLFLILYGLVQVFQETFTGLIFSLLISASGLFAFTIHTILFRRGRDEFKVPISIFLLGAVLLVSIMQIAVTIYLLT
jgi:hypothetical protein